jgi:hypothetical protein
MLDYATALFKAMPRALSCRTLTCLPHSFEFLS